MTTAYPTYPEMPDGARSWSHVGTDAEAANIFAVTVPVIFYDKADNRYTVFQKFPRQKPLNNSLMIDELSIGRMFVVVYRGFGAHIKPFRIHEYKLDGGHPVIGSSMDISGRQALIRWYKEHGRQKPKDIK
jgi:hypothetical protein